MDFDKNKLQDILIPTDKARNEMIMIGIKPPSLVQFRLNVDPDAVPIKNTESHFKEKAYHRYTLPIFTGRMAEIKNQNARFAHYKAKQKK